MFKVGDEVEWWIGNRRWEGPEWLDLIISKVEEYCIYAIDSRGSKGAWSKTDDLRLVNNYKPEDFIEDI